MADRPVPFPGEPAALRRALHWNARGLRYKAAGRYHAARRCYRRALRMLWDAGRRDGNDLATLFHNLGGIAHALGEFVAGEAVARAGLRLRLAGPADAEMVAKDLIALAALLDGQRRFDEAEQLYLIGLSTLRRVPRRNEFEVAVALGGLGCQYAERGHLAAAVRLLARAAELKERCLTAGHPSLLLTQRNLALARSPLPRKGSGA